MKRNETHSDELFIPKWMSEKNKLIEKDKSRSHFLKKTLTLITDILQNEVFSEKYVSKKGFLQKIDPRNKLLTFIVFLILGAISTNIIVLIFLTFITIINVSLSGLNLKSYFKRVWMTIPLIVFILSLPAATSLFTEGTPLFYITRTLYFTPAGLALIVKMSLRVGISVSFGYLMIMTTRWNSLTMSLSILRVPALIISVINMTYRFILVLCFLTAELFEARFLRTVGNIKNKENRGFIAHSASFLFIRSSFMSNEIYDAMRCRGFTGEPVSLRSLKLSRADYIWILNNVLIFIILIAGEIFIR